MTQLVAPSILSADFGNLQRDIEMLQASEADWIHVDIMDGLFVPNLSFGFPVMKAARPHTTKPFDVHLMIVDPDRYLKNFKDSGADHITVHLEACTHLHRTIQAIKDLGCKAGVALNPHTSVSLLENIFSDIDIVCIMSVNPGFGGQKFIPNTYSKIKQLRNLAEYHNPNLLIEIDGGVESSNAAALVDAGANVLVAGSAVFSANDQPGAISVLKHAQTQKFV